MTETTILQHIRAVEWQLDRLAEIRPDAPIKPLILPRDRAKSVAPEAEQQKYIGEAATVLTVATLRRLVGNGLSLGGILMLLGMARTAEACAPKFGEIVLRDDYAVIAIVWQADGTTRIADLKTDNSYRLIILPKSQPRRSGRAWRICVSWGTQKSKYGICRRFLPSGIRQHRQARQRSEPSFFPY